MNKKQKCYICNFEGSIYHHNFNFNIKYLCDNCKNKKTEEIKKNLRSAVSHLINNKKDKFYWTIGCNSTELRNYLEKQFKNNINWTNYKKLWIIDHIIPLDKFNLTDPREMYRANHYTNLQPMTYYENSQKGSSVDSLYFIKQSYNDLYKQQQKFEDNYKNLLMTL